MSSSMSRLAEYGLPVVTEGKVGRVPIGPSGLPWVKEGKEKEGKAGRVRATIGNRGQGRQSANEISGILVAHIKRHLHEGIQLV